jgi:carbon monoxide dehydrogenase subunit G
MRIEGSVDIDCPVEQAWAFLSNWDNFSKWYVLQPGEEYKKTTEGPL